MTQRIRGHTNSKQVLLAVLPGDAGSRLDRFLADRVPDLTRSRAQALIRSGNVAGPGGTIGDASVRVKPGDEYSVSFPPVATAIPQAETIPLSIVFEDRHLIVVDKPAGLVVHPAVGHGSGTLVNALIAHCGESLSGIGGVRRPGIVHRLDKETSGLLVAAKTDEAHVGLQEQFASHGADGRLARTYLALVWGAPQRRRGTIDAPLSRSATNRTKIAVARGEGGRRAVTHYEVLETFADVSGKPVAALLAIQLETGRTHQIRVHLAHIGYPVMGDPTYGSGFKASRRRLSSDAQASLDALGRQALHASELGFEHPVTRRRLGFKSALPADMAALLGALRGRGSASQKPGRLQSLRAKHG